MLRLVALAAAALLAAASPAFAADPNWTAQPVSEAGALPPTGLTFAGDGTGLLTYESFVQGRASPKSTELALRSPSGTWAAPVALPGVTWGLARVHVVGSRAVMVGMHAYAFGAFNRARWEVVHAIGPIGDAFGPVRTLVRPVAWVGSAGGGHGEVLVAWLDRGTAALHAQRLLPRRGRALTLAPRDAFGPVVEIGSAGHALVAWGRDHVVEARVRAPNGVWGPVRLVGRAPIGVQDLNGRIDSRGRAVLAWAGLSLDEDRPAHLTFYGASTDARGRWSSKRLDSYMTRRSIATARAVAGLDGDSRPFVVWPGRAGSGVQLNIARPGGKLLDTIPAPLGVRVEQVALSLTGELALAWTAPTPAQGPGPGPFVATTPRITRWGAPADVGVAGTAPLVDVRLAFSPVTSQPTIAWGLVQDGSSRVWAATRGP